MKIQILDIDGKKIKEATTELFEEPIRKDIIYKIVEYEKIKQPYRPRLYAGMDRSASGNVLHTRHDWKTDRGRGMSRFPKKTMWRRGTQFSWIAAIIPSARGGRRAHPPKAIIEDKKINKKEMIKGILSALTYSNSIEEIKNKYSSLQNKKIENKFPLVIENKILELKTKEFLDSLKKILGELYDVSIRRTNNNRAGIGKMRGRRNKKNAGILFIISKEESIKVKGIEVVKANKLRVSDIAGNGARLTLFTEKAIKELETLGNKK